MSAKKGSALLARSRGRTICLTIAAVMCVGAGFASSANAEKVPTKTLLTLGDSLTFGYSQQLLNEGSPLDLATGFEHGFTNDMVAKHLKSWQLVNLGCPGETTNSFIGNGPVGEELGETSEAPCAYHETSHGGYHLPLHTEYGGVGVSQLEAALYQIGKAKTEGKPVEDITVDIFSNDELHAIAHAEAEARAAAEAAGNAAAYKYVGEAETPGTEAYKAAEKVGNEAGYKYAVEAQTPGTEAYEAAQAAGYAAYVAALEEGKTPEEAAAAGKAAGEAYVGAHAYAAGKAAGEAYVGAQAYAIGKAAAEKYGAEHGLAEVKAWLEGHALELFTHIVTNNVKILATLRGAGYTGKITVIGGYDPYGNLLGTGEVLGGSTSLAKSLNVLLQNATTASPYSACFANPYPKFNPGGKKEPERLQAYTNMTNTKVSNGKADGPDIHPTPLGYEVIAKVVKKACGL